jgi:uncharacterized membrane protein YesL
MRSWLRRVIYNPGSWMKISGIFLLCALPLVTAGWAWGIALTLARRDVEERKLLCFKTVRGAFSRRGALLFVMGFIDLWVVFFLLASVYALFRGETGLPMKACSALFIWADLLILCSGMYRYPLAIYNDDLPFRDIMFRGVLMTLSRPGQTTLFVLAFISILVLSAVTGLALFLFAPGAIAFFCVYVYLDRVYEANPSESG